MSTASGLRQVLLSKALQDLDQALQSEHVALVRPVMDGRVATETLESGVGEVDHAKVHLGELVVWRRGNHAGGWGQ